MPKRLIRALELTSRASLLLLGLTFTNARADWPITPDGLPICVKTGEQDGALGVPDGAGGSIICWTDASPNSRVHAQRATQMGDLLWAPNGIPLLLGTLSGVAPDGSGGVFIVVGYASNVYAQHLDATGAPLWGSNGVVVCDATGTQTPATSIVPLADGGAVFTWMDGRSGSSSKAPYVQRLSAAGSPLWTPNGVAATALTLSTFGGLTTVSDSAGGAIVSWDNYTDVFSQRIDLNGNRRWGGNGVFVTDAVPSSQIHVESVSDGSGGAFLAWWDARVLLNSAHSDIYGQHLDSNGNALWAPTGIPLVAENLYQRNVTLVGDGSGGVILAWYDGRAASSGYDLYAQRVDASGAPQWAADGVRLTGASTVTSPPSNRAAMTADGYGGAIVTWVHPPSAGVYEVRAQRVSAGGSPLWSPGGVVTAAAAGFRYRPELVADGTGGSIVTWYDARSGNGDIYAQRVDGNGDLGPGGVTAVQISLASLEVTGDGVRIVWHSGSPEVTAVVERRTDSGAWRDLAQLTMDGLNRFSHLDRTVMAGERYGYRLRLRTRGAVEFAGEAWVNVPGGARLALVPLESPSRGTLEMSFTLPDGTNATMELLDVSGRVIRRVQVGSYGAGTHSLRLGPDQGLRAGVYFVRLSQGTSALVKRVSVLN